jgi:hypothetical protein
MLSVFTAQSHQALSSLTADYEAVRAYSAIIQTTTIWIHTLHCYSVVHQIQILRNMECDS